jgi:hypothetical protein
VPTAKVTWFYQYGDYGWTESLWQPYATDLAETFPAAELYASTRMALNGSGIVLTAIRASDDAVFRDSKYDPKSYVVTGGEGPTYIPQQNSLAGVKPSTGNPNEPPANPYDAIQIRMEGGSLYRREMMLRGAPQSIMTSPPGPMIQGSYAQAFLRWTNTVQANWTFRAKSRAGANALMPVTNVTIGPPSTVTVPGNGYVAGDYIQLIGFRGLASIRGKYTVVSNAAGVLQLLGFTPLQSVTKIVGYAQLLSTNNTPLQPSYQSITSIRVITQTHRKTGRPSFGPRGRSAARVH